MGECVVVGVGCKTKTRIILFMGSGNETTSQCNVVSHWQIPYTECSMRNHNTTNVIKC